MHDLTYAFVDERTIDVMLVEELRCAPAFLNWFVRQAAPDAGPVALERVLHSVAAADDGDGWGETDIWLMVRGREGTRLLLLIENKIDAAFQERQAKRYRYRAAEAVQRGEADAPRCVLIGSQDYLRSAPDAGEFDALAACAAELSANTASGPARPES